jgi:PAS domain S-box-containing protein
MYTGRGGMTALIAHEGQIYGVLAVSIPAERIDDEEERELLDEVAGDLGFALHAMRLAEERDRLHESLTDAHRIVEASPAVLFHWRPSEGWPVEYVSENVVRFGYSPEDFLSGRIRYEAIVHPEDRDRVAAEVGQHAAGTGTAFRQEYRILDPGGGIHWVDDRTTIERDAAGAPSAFRGLVLDVTESKRAEQALREREEELNAILENAPFVVVVVDPERRVRKMNALGQELAGRPPEQVLGLRGGEALRCVHALDDPRGCGYGPACEACPVRNTVLSTLQTGARHHDIEAQMTFRRGDGEVERTILVHTAPIELGGERHAMVVFQDITERKLTEAALGKSIEEHRRLFETMTQGVVYHDADGSIIAANAAAERILGLSHDQILGRTSTDPLWRCLHEDGSDFPGETHPAMVALRTGEPVNQVTMGVYKPDEHACGWIRVSAVPLFRPGEETPYQAYAIFEDITERRAAQEALRESERKHRMLFEQATNPILVVDEEARYVDANEAALAFLECDRSELFAKKVWEFAPPGQLEAQREEHAPFVARRTLETDYYVNGRVKTLLLNVTPLQTQAGTVLYGIGQDITGRKTAEAALKESEARYRTLIEQSGDCLLVHDFEGNLIDVNDWSCQTYGYTREELLSMKVSDLDPDYEEREAGGAFWDRLDLYQPVFFEARQKTKSGEIFPAEIRLSLIRRNGAIVVMGCSRDITERKRAEEALRESERELRRAQAVAHVGSWQFDFRTRVVTASDEAKRIYGLQGDRWTFEEVQQMSLPECRPALDEAMRALIEDGAPYDVEFRIRRADTGEIRHVHSVAEYDPDRRVATGAVQDVTERKRAEDELRESEHRFRAFVENANDVVYALDAEGRFTYISPNWERFMGEPAAAAIGESFKPYVHPEDVHLCEEFLRDVLVSGEPKETVEYRVCRADGQVRWHVSNGSPLRDETGAITGYIGIARDVTEAKEIENELRESEHRIQSIFRSAPVGIGVVMDRVLKGANPKLCEITGYTEEELADQSARMLYPTDEDFDFVGQEKYRQISECGTGTVETKWKRKDGSIIDVLLSSTPIDMSDLGKGVTFTALDITEQKQMAERLRQMEKMDAIGQLAGGIAHDFNNQLAGIMGYADLLRARLDDERLRRYVDCILAASHRSADLTQQLLAFARKGQYRSVEVDLHAIVAEVVAILQHTIDRRIEIQQILKASPPTTTGDPSQLQSAILNLAINARDAMPRGGELIFETKTVELDDAYCRNAPYPMEPGRYVRLSVTDSGCGMDAQTRKRIFEPFFTTKEVGKGSGMGLAAVFGTVKHHGGSVNVYSEPGRGSTFAVYLPLAAQHSAEAESPGAEKIGGPCRARILVADDEEIFRGLAQDLLETAGHTVRTKKNGASAVEYYQKHREEIDLVILDMVMPKMDGAEAFRAIRAFDPDAKVLLASGYSINGAAQTLLAEGVKGFLQKPFSREEMLRAIAEALHEEPQGGR